VPLKYWINKWLWSSLDWIFPPVCGGCNQTGFRWCPDCRQRIRIVPGPICLTCGLPILHPGQCHTCKTSTPPYKVLRSWLVFEGPIRQAVHQLKYKGNIALGDALVQDLSAYVRSLEWEVDMVVPVPLGKERMKMRGFNQVGLVAMPLAAINQWRYVPQALVRLRETLSQVGLNVSERKVNVDGAFQANGRLVLGRTILLIDDVATTGATISACTTALLNAGAISIYALTLARALYQPGYNVN
jgi:competence protein ComFC